MRNRLDLGIEEVLDRIGEALRQEQPFSLVRIGDGENLVMAQEKLWPLERVLEERWAVKANKGHKGLTLPNLELRDAVVDSVRRADVVGILRHGDETIKAPGYLKRELTDQIFDFYGLAPAFTCDACLNRKLATSERFWVLLRGKRILLVTREVGAVQPVLESTKYGMNIVQTIAFDGYHQMEETLAWIGSAAGSFDVALFSCGVNAVVLAQRTAELTGAVALDFGKAINIIVYGKPN